MLSTTLDIVFISGKHIDSAAEACFREALRARYAAFEDQRPDMPTFIESLAMYRAHQCKSTRSKACCVPRPAPVGAVARRTSDIRCYASDGPVRKISDRGDPIANLLPCILPLHAGQAHCQTPSANTEGPADCMKKFAQDTSPCIVVPSAPLDTLAKHAEAQQISKGHLKYASSSKLQVTKTLPGRDAGSGRLESP
eukprot:365297-Chlamydomonas_euryale.AAC.10